MEWLVREAVELELYSNNMKREDGLAERVFETCKLSFATLERIDWLPVAVPSLRPFYMPLPLPSRRIFFSFSSQLRSTIEPPCRISSPLWARTAFFLFPLSHPFLYFTSILRYFVSPLQFPVSFSNLFSLFFFYLPPFLCSHFYPFCTTRTLTLLSLFTPV